MRRSLEDSYDEFPRIEEAFGEMLDESLGPRGPDSLYDLVANLRLPPGSSVLDVGCGEGIQAVELSKRFRFDVAGIDPVLRHVDLARMRLAEVGANGVIEKGSAEAIPISSQSVDLIWCREVLVLVEDLRAAFAEFRRVLRPGGHILLYQMFATAQMGDNELAAFCEDHYAASSSWRVTNIEAAFHEAGFEIEQCIEFGSEWGEFAQEQRGDAGRQLVHAARLLRDPERYISQFGQANYDIKLADCFWHINRMIGKLSGRAYLLLAPVAAAGK